MVLTNSFSLVSSCFKYFLSLLLSDLVYNSACYRHECKRQTEESKQFYSVTKSLSMKSKNTGNILMSHVLPHLQSRIHLYFLINPSVWKTNIVFMIKLQFLNIWINIIFQKYEYICFYDSSSI